MIPLTQQNLAQTKISFKGKTLEIYEQLVESGFKHALTIANVLNEHRKSNYWAAYNLAVPIAKAIDKYPDIVIEEAYQTFLKQGNEVGKVPHPNYFTKLVPSLYEDWKKNRNSTNIGIVI